MATVLVTGARRGIGRAISLVLARAGHQVHATMRNPSSDEQLIVAAREESLNISVLELDVRDDQSVKCAIEDIIAKHGAPDVLINNAGIVRGGAVEDSALHDFDDVIQTNYLGALRCIKAVLPTMRECGSGHIVNISSVAGQVAYAPSAPYSASKFALEAMSECLAQEVAAFGIRVTLVQPGIIDTELARTVPDLPPSKTYPQLKRIGLLFKASLMRPTPPDTVAEAVREIVEGRTKRLRVPIGADAKPFIAWRQAMTDEQWIAWGSASDDEWFAWMERDFGLRLRDFSSD